MNDMIPGLAYLLVVGFFAFVVFLAIRQFVLWYYRINEMADNLAYIANHFREIDQAKARQRIEETRMGSPGASSSARLRPVGITSGKWPES